MSSDSLVESRAPGYHVFSVRSVSARGVHDVKSYTTRKPHKKSRLGCGACKQKRVKCDEKQPACGRCQKSKLNCEYRALSAYGSRKSAVSNSTVGSISASSALSATAGAIPIPRSMEKGSQAVHLMKHYDAITGGEQDTITCSDLLVGDQSRGYRMAVLRLAQEHSYLLHGILSIAALHLDHFRVPGYRIPKLSHFQVTLSEFQRAINKPITKTTSDAILLTSMMINMQYFCYIDSAAPEDSWVFSSSPARLDWLSMQMGLTPLVHSTAQFHSESLLRPVWAFAAYERDDDSGLPPAFWRLCGIHHEKAKNLQRNPYYHALQSLAPLMRAKPCTDHLIKYLSCLGGLNRKFFARAQVNDPAALLILAYWFGLMCHVDFWWCRRRVQRDTTALCMFLDRHADDDVIRSLLAFPADACGYTIIREH